MEQINLQNIPTAELFKELERRKRGQIPQIVNDINTNIDILKSFGLNIIYADDCSFALKEIVFDEDTMEILYKDTDITR